MSSISAVEDCESTPGNPGDFRYRLLVRKTDELGNQVIIGDYASTTIEIHDGDILGMDMEPIRFLMPLDDPDARFEVEYWLGEYEGATADFENHGWAYHIYQRENQEQEWRPGVDFQDYTEKSDGEKYGLHKFTVWNTRDNCKGFARYIVRWKPVVIE